MAWSATGGFAQTFADGHNGVVVINLGLETHKGALFDNTVTPDFNATAANTAYGAGTWTTGKEITGTGYTAGGATLTNTTVTIVAGGIEQWDADDLAWTGSTFSGAYGALLYADALTTPVADQGLVAVYFGGAFSVTAGTFSVVWNASGIMRPDWA